uniref:Uncharacterized protein n=1 Tax=Onchocerca volvulus TaxID=6282 RepID=A0A8R1TKJ2_ONCVO
MIISHLKFWFGVMQWFLFLINNCSVKESRTETIIYWNKANTTFYIRENSLKSMR